MSEIKTNKISPSLGTTLTIGDAGDTITTAGAAVGFGGLFASYAIIADEKADTTVGGTFTSGSWQTRDLNTEITDPDTIVSISTNQFTLAAGSYLIQWSAPGFRCGAHKTRLYDVTGTAAIQEGSSSYQSFSQDVQSISNGSARVTPSGSNVYRIEHRCSNSASSGTTGFGEPSSFGDQEVYTSVTIYKES